MLRVAVAGLVTLALAAPAAAQELPAANVCVGQNVPKPPPTPAEKEQAALQEYARQRAEFGFRHDIPYIQELIKKGVWEYDVGYIPVTPAENRYLKLRDELELGTPAEKYLDKHKDVDGGVSVEDKWPHEPYLLLHLKRDVARHLAAIRRLAKYPHNLRAERVKYSDHELEQIAKQLWKDAKRLDAAGFHLESTGHAADGYLHVELITKRTDYKAYFTKRYGKALKFEVYAIDVYSYVCSASKSYRVAEDGMSVTVAYDSGGQNQFARIEVSEFPDHVEVGVVEKVYNGGNTDDLRFETAVAKLSAPLGDRPVLDAYNKQPLRQIGARPGQPPCPPKPPEPTALQQAMAERAGYGMRADEGYVRYRLNSRSLYTKAEARWRARVEKLKQDYEADEQLSRRFPQTYAGSVIVARYPKTPTIEFRFKDHASLAAARRASKYPKQVRVRNVGFSRAELGKLQQRVEDDLQQTNEFDGFHVAGARVDDESGTLQIELVTTRTDGQAYFAARYGPSTRVEVVGDRLECYLDRGR